MATTGGNHPKEPRTRHVEGWEFARTLVEYISSHRRDPGRDHVSQLLRAVSKIRDEHTPLSDVRSLAKTVQHSLRRYVQRPTCFLGESQGRGFLVFDVQPDGKGTPSEHRAVNALIRLAEVGLLGRLHHCHSSRCRRWLYGKSTVTQTAERHTSDLSEVSGNTSERSRRNTTAKERLGCRSRRTGKSIRAIADRLQTTPQRIEYWLKQAAPKDSSRRSARVRYGPAWLSVGTSCDVNRISSRHPSRLCQGLQCLTSLY